MKNESPTAKLQINKIPKTNGEMHCQFRLNIPKSLDSELEPGTIYTVEVKPGQIIFSEKKT